MAGKTKKTTAHDPSTIPIVNVFVEDDKGQTQDAIPSPRRPVVVEVEADEKSEQKEKTPHVSARSLSDDEQLPDVPASSTIDIPTPDLPVPSFFEHDKEEVEPTVNAPFQKHETEEVVSGEEASLSGSQLDSGKEVKVAQEIEEENVVIPSFLQEETEQSQETFKHKQTADPVHADFSEIDVQIPQAIMGELNEINDDVRDERKKVIGIVFIVTALVVAAVGFFLITRMKAGQQNQVVSTPTPRATSTPTPTPVATPTPSASASAELKKTVSVSVLNGTTIPGLAGKQVALLKTAGYAKVTGANGSPDDAGTIVVPKDQQVIGDDIAKILKDFTFIVTESTTAKSIIVTLGQPTAQ